MSRDNYKQLRKYIRVIDERNKKLEVTKLLGVSVKKIFINSIANTVGTDFKKYKIVRKLQFTYIADTSRRGDKIGLAMLEDYDEALVSQAYTVFEVIDHNELDPEYLMMWFRRPEFDRYARYKSHGSVREIFDWNEMCETELPIPTIEKQREIVKKYNTIVNRIKLNEQLTQKLEETAQALYKHWFVDFEFPNANREPYKSSGGKMVYNAELDKEVPEGWEVKPLASLGKIKGGKRMPSGEELISESNEHPYIKIADMGIDKFVILNNNFEYVPKYIQSQIARYIVSKGDVILSIVGTIGIVKIIHDSLHNANLTENCVKITELSKICPSYLYHYFLSKEGREETTIRNVGAVQAKLPIYNIETFPILCATENISLRFTSLTSILDNEICNNQEENISSNNLRNLLLSKMTKVETEKEVV